MSPLLEVTQCSTWSLLKLLKGTWWSSGKPLVLLKTHANKRYACCFLHVCLGTWNQNFNLLCGNFTWLKSSKQNGGFLRRLSEWNVTLECDSHSTLSGKCTSSDSCQERINVVVCSSLCSTTRQCKFFISPEMCVVICGIFQSHSSHIFYLHIKVFYKEYGQLVVIRIWICWI